MQYFYIIVAVALVGVAIFFMYRELRHPGGKKEKMSNAVLKNKRLIERSANNLESMIVLAEGNDTLVAKLTQLKDTIKFLNPSKSDKVMLVDTKIANKLDDIKIEISKDTQAETILRMIEEVEGFLAQRSKEEGA